MGVSHIDLPTTFDGLRTERVGDDFSLAGSDWQGTAGEDPLDHGVLALAVLEEVGCGRTNVPLDGGVLITQLGIFAQRISQAQVVLQRQEILNHDIGVGPRQSRRLLECPPLRDAQLAESLDRCSPGQPSPQPRGRRQPRSAVVGEPSRIGDVRAR